MTPKLCSRRGIIGGHMSARARWCVIAMVAWLLWRDRSPAAASSGWQGAHLLWAFGVLWSPESAFYVTFVWWPYYLWLRCSQRSGPGATVRLSMFPSAARILLLRLFVVLFCFIAGYWLIYRTAPTAKRLGRTGWLVVDRKFPADEWLKDFQSAYRVDRTMDFGSDYAIRFMPE